VLLHSGLDTRLVFLSQWTTCTSENKHVTVNCIWTKKYMLQKIQFSSSRSAEDNCRLFHYRKLRLELQTVVHLKLIHCAHAPCFNWNIFHFFSWINCCAVKKHSLIHLAYHSSRKERMTLISSTDRIGHDHIGPCESILATKNAHIAK